ncbi:MAG TPA: FHA domain-containing protein [Thermoanaerobaculia bacterium]
MRFEFGEFVFDGEARALTRGGESVRLAPKAFDLLAVLIAERPRAIRKRELQDRLWPDVVVEEANLKNLVGEIRAALGDDRWIRTVHRYGYAFASPPNGAVERTTAARIVCADRIHRLREGVNLLGRDDDCAVILDFVGVSRHHARITVRDGGATLDDLGRKNGTWRNEERVESAVDLRDGDAIRLGSLTVVFRSRPQPLTESLADLAP